MEVFPCIVNCMRTKAAVILAGGEGKRLHKFETIKPLIRVGGKPLILHVIERLIEAQVTNIAIVVSNGDRLVQRALLAYADELSGIEIRYVEQLHNKNSMLGSVLSLKDVVSSDFILTVCDVVFEKNPFLFFPEEVQNDRTISVLFSVDPDANIHCGGKVRAHLQNESEVVALAKGLKDAEAIETGIYHFASGAFSAFSEFLKNHPEILMYDQALSAYNTEQKLCPILLKKCVWFDVNTPSTLIRAELFLRKKHDFPDREKQETPRLLPLKKTISFSYKKDMGFDVFVKSHLLEHLEDYAVIPEESFYSPHHLIVDKNIDDLYGKKVFEKLTELGYHVHKIVVDPGEWTKSVNMYIRLAHQILTEGIDKKSILISLGGGVVKDLVGFLASTLYRGIGSIHIPTTLLAQCDAAIALKQGVNGEGGKNLLGSFYAPLKVLVDPAVLLTLDDRYLRDGLAECLKQAFAQSKTFYNFFDQYSGSLKNLPFLEKVIDQSIKLKIPTIEKDFNEDKEGLVYQYGHEIGHAVEYLSGYDLGHGESVAVGMRVSAELARLLGVADDETICAQFALMKKFGLDIRVPKDIVADDIIETLRFNKKFHSGQARFVLVKSIGSLWHDRSMYTVFCSDDIVRKAIERSYEDPE